MSSLSALGHGPKQCICVKYSTRAVQRPQFEKRKAGGFLTSGWSNSTEQSPRLTEGSDGVVVCSKAPGASRVSTWLLEREIWIRGLQIWRLRGALNTEPGQAGRRVMEHRRLA